MDKALKKFQGNPPLGDKRANALPGSIGVDDPDRQMSPPKGDLISACLQAGGELVFGRTVRIDIGAKRSVNPVSSGSPAV
jgi:hypothetical protein